MIKFIIIGILWEGEMEIGEGYTTYSTQNSMVIDEDNVLHAVWFHYIGSGARYRVIYGKFKEGKWEIKDISYPYTTFCAHPTLTIVEEKLYCVWNHGWDYSQLLIRKLENKEWEDTVGTVVSDKKYVFQPTMINDGENVHVVWVEGFKIKYKTLEKGEKWSKEEMISKEERYAILPIIKERKEKIYVCWAEFGGGIYLREKEGKKWKGIVKIGDGGVYSHMYVDERNEVHVVWEKLEKGKYKILYTSYKEGKVSPPIVIVDSPKDARFPNIIGRGRELYLVWCDNRDGVWEIYFKEYENEWKEEKRITFDNYNSYHPKITINENGIYLLFWEKKEEGRRICFKWGEFEKRRRRRKTDWVVRYIKGGVEVNLGEEKEITIYDAIGRVVTSFNLRNGRGVWDCRNMRGEKVSGGIYFLRTKRRGVKKIYILK